MKFAYRLIFILFLGLWLPTAVFGQNFDTVDSAKDFDVITQVMIQYRRLDWQTFEFSAKISDPTKEILAYLWQLDSTVVYINPTVQYVFSPGDHVVELTVKDASGNLRHDQVKLKVSFWSFENRVLWWLLYGFLILMFVYYWMVKLVYLINKKRARKHAKFFVAVLDRKQFEKKIKQAMGKKKG
jgi:hypothetical protein